jgi:uncharacterized spore protein YtfJ
MRRAFLRDKNQGESPMSASEILHSLLERLQQSANVKAVYGEPIEARGKTIIPVAKVGFGIGGGEGMKHCLPTTEDKGGEGMGLGGGVGAKPLGVLEVTDEATRFIPITSQKKLLAAAAVGLLIGLILGKRR